MAAGLEHSALARAEWIPNRCCSLLSSLPRARKLTDVRVTPFRSDVCNAKLETLAARDFSTSTVRWLSMTEQPTIPPARALTCLSRQFPVQMIFGPSKQPTTPRAVQGSNRIPRLRRCDVGDLTRPQSEIGVWRQLLKPPLPRLPCRKPGSWNAETWRPGRQLPTNSCLTKTRLAFRLPSLNSCPVLIC